MKLLVVFSPSILLPLLHTHIPHLLSRNVTSLTSEKGSETTVKKEEEEEEEEDMSRWAGANTRVLAKLKKVSVRLVRCTFPRLCLVCVCRTVRTWPLSFREIRKYYWAIAIAHSTVF